MFTAKGIGDIYSAKSINHETTAKPLSIKKIQEGIKITWLDDKTIEAELFVSMQKDSSTPITANNLYLELSRKIKQALKLNLKDLKIRVIALKKEENEK
ncbi:MAG: hypothetical protein DRP42_01050 [Tenericutes bacterium]|nr:MAG: hypothetical protein DRP42_01050 [Mycoplasmatota bacterium]